MQTLHRAILRNEQSRPLINTGASARCGDAPKTRDLFQQAPALAGKPLKRLPVMSTAGHRAEAPVLMRRDRGCRSTFLPALFCFAFLTASSPAATITGNLLDITGAPLTTQITFSPTNLVLTSAGGLSAGPPRTITATNGTFSIALDPGDYTVCLPLVPWRKCFGISVPASVGTYNITNLLTTIITAPEVAIVAAAGPFGYSANLQLTPRLQQALNSGRSPRLLWLGDATGADTLEAVQRLFETQFLYGLQQSGFQLGAPRYFADNPTGSGKGMFDSAWWNNCLSLTNGATQTFGGAGRGGFIPANRLNFWYLAGSNRGSGNLQTSPDGSSWTTVMTVNTAQGAAGLRVTNVSLSAGSYSTRVTTTSGGPENRIVFLWPDLQNTSSSAAIVAQACGATGSPGSFLAMGTNSIATLLTNTAPDLIVYQQCSSTYNYTNWPAAAALLKTYASNADVVLVSPQISGDTNLESSATDAMFPQVLLDRVIAKTNNWAFVDNWSILNDYSNIVTANAFNASDGTLLHLNSAGQLYAGASLIRQLGLLDHFAAARVLATNSGSFIGITNGADATLASLTTTGNGSISSTDPSGNSLLYTNGSITLSNAATHLTETLTNGGANFQSNVVANAFYGDGSHLTGISGGGGGVVAAGANINVATNGTLYTISHNKLLFSQFTHTNSNAGAETIIWTNSIAGNILTNNGDSLLYFFQGTCGANENHTFKFYVDSDNTLSVTKQLAADFLVEVLIMRDAGNTYQGWMYVFSAMSGGTIAQSQINSSRTCDWTSTTTLGLSATSATAAGVSLYTVICQKLVGTGN